MWGIALLPDDFTAVHLERSEQTFEFIFHNTPEKPCLKLKIDELRRRFLISDFPDA